MAAEVVANRFEILKVAGKGGMGTVFRAVDRTTGAPVALKIVEGDYANARFEREATVLAGLDHEAIVHYVAHGRLGAKRMYLAMEWLEGTPLDERLVAGALPVSESLALAKRLADALAAAHRLGIVHRDVKPANVILRGGDPAQAVLVDFGIARASLATHAMTAPGMVIGTPAYMAPEQARGEVAVDARADVFSLGCVLFECLGGRAPFVGEHVIAVLAKILLEPAPRLSSVRADVPPALDAFVASMLEKLPAERPADGGAVAIALDKLAQGGSAGGGTVAPAAGLGASERRFATVLLARTGTAPGAVGHAETEDALDGMTAESEILHAALQVGMSIAPLANGMYVGALFAKDAGADSASLVARCAIAMRARMPEGNIAVVTGRAIMADDRVPVGDAIDRAARLLASPGAKGGISLDEATASVIEGRFEIERSPDAIVLVRERDSAELSRTVMGRIIPFVGRDREMDLLGATFRECVDEPVACAALVVAPPGTGKSRLRRELVARLAVASPEPDVWIGLADPVMQRAPFSVAGDVLRRLIGLTEDEPLGLRRARIVARLRGMMPEAGARVAAFIGEIVGTPFEDDADPLLRVARRNAALLTSQIRDAVLALATSRLAQHPLLIVLEDVHWADVASLGLFEDVLARAKDRPVMLLGLARPSVDEAHPNLWNELRCQRVTLAPLLRKASEKLARSVLGDRLGDRLGDWPEIDAIVERAAGNALFVEELARACAEGRAADDLPATIAAATEARLSAVEAPARQVLRAASIFGERFWPGGVTHLLAGHAGALAQLTRVEQLELVSVAPQSRFADEREYFFRHAFMRDAAYEMLTDEDRALGHALAGEWLEARVDDGALLAHHYLRGARLADAARCSVRAAEQALAAHDIAGVFRHAADAEAAGGTAAVLGPARLAEAEANLWMGKNEEAAKAGQAAVASLERGSVKWFVAVGVSAAATGKTGDSAALYALADALERTPADGAPAGRARAIARARTAVQISYFGDVARFDALLEGCEREPGAEGDLGVLAWLIDARCERGHASGESVHPSVMRRGRELCFAIGDRRAALGQWASEAQLLSTVGAHEEALRVADALAKEAGDSSRFVAGYVAGVRAVAAGVGGDLGPLLAFTQSRAANANPRLMTTFLSLAAMLLLGFGRLDEAKVHAERAAYWPDGPPMYQALGLAVLARIAVTDGDVSRAVELSERALASCEHAITATGAPTIYLSRFIALEAAGRHDDARDALRAGLRRVTRLVANLGEYRASFLSAYECPALLERAREHGLELDRDGAVP